MVYGIDDMSNGLYSNLDYLMGRYKDRFVFEQIDIRDFEKLKSFISTNSITHIFHLAAIASVQQSISNPILSSSVNLQGTLNVLEAARCGGVKRVVFSSSAAVYGDEPSLPKNEDSTLKPISPYGYEKLMSEQYMKLYHDLYGLETVSLRYFNVYGKGQRSDSEYSGVISIFENMIKNNKTPMIYGDGTQYRDFIHIDDIVKINLKAMQKEGISGETICVGTGIKTSVNEIFDTISSKYNYSYKPIYKPARDGDIYASVCDNSKLKSLLEIDRFISFQEGILKYE
jgi:UDP-glucose 4-epimerase